MANENCLYAELIEMLKKKDAEKNKSCYQQLEMPSIGDEQIKEILIQEQNIEERGIVIIDLLTI